MSNRYFMLLYFRFYVCSGGKFITLTVFNYEHTAKTVLFKIVEIIDFDIFYQIGFTPVVCTCFYLYTAFGCHYREIHHAVLRKTIAFTVPAAVHFAV